MHPTLVVLLQGVWAGIFIQPRADDTFVGIHSIGAYVAIVLAVAATVVARLAAQPVATGAVP
jgi:hypothetical protein